MEIHRRKEAELRRKLIKTHTKNHKLLSDILNEHIEIERKMLRSKRQPRLMQHIEVNLD